MSARAWSADDDKRLELLVAQHEHATIARLLGRSTAAVRNRCHKLGLVEDRFWNANDIGKLRAAYSSKLEPVRIAALATELGRHKTNVSRKARELGLTARSRAHDMDRESVSARVKSWIELNGHPRGALGLTHSTATRRQIADKSRASWADPNSKFNSAQYRQALSDRMAAWAQSRPAETSYSRTLSGKRADLGDLYLRSSWEANYARFLNLLVRKKKIAGWEYEAHTFVFERIQRGTRSYTPDFKVTLNSGRVEWHEVKGWMDQKSRTRLDRMRRYFPAETVRVVGADWFWRANKCGLADAIPNWERPKSRSK